jgi:hypothetical protein
MVVRHQPQPEFLRNRRQDHDASISAKAFSDALARPPPNGK